MKRQSSGEESAGMDAGEEAEDGAEPAEAAEEEEEAADGAEQLGGYQISNKKMGNVYYLLHYIH